MSNIKIEIVATDVTQPEGKKYQTLEVTYKNLSFQGKVENKKLNSFYAKEIFPILADAKKGEVFDIAREKEGEYWTWKSIVTGGSAPAVSSGGSAPAASKSSGGKYVDDMVKQTMIIRQSSISSAVNLLKEINPTPAGVIEAARLFEAYVLEEKPIIDFTKLAKVTEAAKQAVAAKNSLPEDLDDDLPY